MQKPKLVIMAAGLGSRYGGPKQIAPVDDCGHIIIDFSIYDARKAGFSQVVFVVKPELEREFHEAIGKRIAGNVDISYAHQTLSMIPAGCAVPEERKKPWGTAHAVLCAEKYIDGPFAVINADDYYGPSAFRAIFDFLTAPGPENAHAMVGYRLENTLSESGAVARGICDVDAGGFLREIIERTKIVLRPEGPAYTEDGETYIPIAADTTVSMNMWGFKKGMIDEIRTRFTNFFTQDVPKNPLGAEYYLPYVPRSLIHAGKATVSVLATQEKWFGVTYAADMPYVRDAIAQKKADGVYPRLLWK